MADDATRYKLYDRVEKVYVGSDYTDRKRARSAADRKDNEYGAIRYSVDPVTYKDGAWRGRNDQATSVRGGHALADRLGVSSDSGPTKEMRQEAQNRYEQVKASKSGGGSGGVSDTKEMQLGADLDPKSMMKREGYKKGGTASSRGDGCAQRGKTKGRMV
jgi:hypothetical protein